MERIVLGLELFWVFFNSQNQQPHNMPWMLPTEAEEKVGYTSRNHITIRTLQWVLTSALDSDSDSVLDSTVHFCCRGGRESNATQCRSYCSFRLKLRSSTNYRCWVSPNLPHLKPACLSKYSTEASLITPHPPKTQREADQNVPRAC